MSHKYFEVTIRTTQLHPNLTIHENIIIDTPLSTGTLLSAHLVIMQAGLIKPLSNFLHKHTTLIMRTKHSNC
jgi:hypothetical protein